jgi:DNA-binding SARP family transcriptional activator/Tfp pilus assembly protein PilF
VHYRILGPLEVLADRPVDLGGRIPRTLLAVLLANPGRHVSLTYLIDAVWEDHPPGTAKRQVQNYLAALRRSLAEAGAGDPLTVTAGPGYQLRPGPGEVDSQVFAEQVRDALRLAAGGRAEAAARQLRSALGIWRGPALLGLTGRAIEAAAASLEEQRLAAVEHRIDLELALGRHAELIAELTELVAVHPLRERLVGLLMVALHHIGRQSDALRAYETHRGVLAEELGLDPGVALRELHEAVLVGNLDGARGGSDVTVRPPEAPTAPVPAQLPPDVAEFAGRADQLKMLDGLLPDHDGPATAGPVCAIAGMAGVGKTALAVHWGHRARSRFPDGQLYLDLRAYSPGPDMRQPEALTHLLRSLGVPPNDIPTEVDLAVGHYRSLLARRRVLVVLDNAANADQVRPLLPAGPGSMALVTSRDRLAGLVARDGARQLTLDVLDPDDALLLLTRLLGEERVNAEAAAVADLAVVCSRLPLALRIAAANVADRPAASIAGLVRSIRGDQTLAALDVAGDERASVRRAFELSYAALTPGARRVFRLLSTVTVVDVTGEAAAALAGTDVSSTDADLQRLAAAHLLYETAAGRYGCHDLLRWFASDRAHAEEPEAAFEAARRRLGDWYLHACDAAARVLYPHRLRLPMPPVDVATPVAFADPPAALAWFDAERANVIAVIRDAAERGPRSTAWLLADTIRGYFWLRVRIEDWTETAGLVLGAARAESDARAEAAARLSLGDTADRQHRREAAIEHYTAALALAEETGWTDGVTAALGKLGSLLMESGRLVESAEHFRRALAHSAGSGSRYAEAVVLGSLGTVQYQLGDLAEATDLYTRSLALFRDLGSGQGEAAVLDALGLVLHAQGRWAEAADHLTDALRLERQVGDRGTEAASLRTLVAVYRDRRQHARAAELANAAVALAEELADRRLEAKAHTTLGTVRSAAGRHWDAIDAHRHSLELTARTGHRYTEVEALLGLAEAHAGLGEPAPALETARRGLAVAEECGFARLARTARDIIDRLS